MQSLPCRLVVIRVLLLHTDDTISHGIAQAELSPLGPCPFEHKQGPYRSICFQNAHFQHLHSLQQAGKKY